MARLGDICKFQSGGTPSKSTPDYFGGTIPWITTIALNGNVINETNAVQWITPKAIQETAAKIVPEYSILVGTRVGVGKVAINSVPMSTSQDIISLINIDSGHWDKKYLCKLILSKNDYLLSQARGATIKGIKIDTLANLIIPDVSLDEQRRIAATLDKVTDLIAKRRQQLDKLDELVKARFVEMFGDPFINPYHLPTAQFGSVLSVQPQNGLYKPQSNYVTDSLGVPILRIDGFYDGKVTDFRNLRRLKCSSDEIIRFSLCENDIVINRVNSIEYLGKCALIKGLLETTVYESNMMRLHVDEKRLNARYVTQLLCSKYIYNQILNRAKKAVNQASINQKDVQSLLIYIPPLELQDQFATFTKQIDQVKANIGHSLAKLEMLKKALMQEYFG